MFGSTKSVADGNPPLSWGRNIYGSLGIGRYPPLQSTTPVQVSALSGCAKVAVGNATGYALLNDGTLWAWGDNRNGQLGNGSTVSPSIGQAFLPTQVGSSTLWSAVAARNNFALALRTDGTLWGWGNNGDGQLGIGSTNTPQISPVQIGSGTSWAQVSTGSFHTLALKNDGTIWAWGSNSGGQCGNGTTTSPVISPGQVGSSSNWVYVAAGAYASYAVKSDGTLWAWGSNADSALGFIGVSPVTNPTQVGSATNWASVTGGFQCAFGIKTDGLLYAWGLNAVGQLGLGDTTNRNTPTQVGSSTWSSVSSGGSFSLGRKTDGSLWAWGYNAYGQLGIGSTTDQLSPVQVGSDLNWTAVSAGFENTLALIS